MNFPISPEMSGFRTVYAPQEYRRSELTAMPSRAPGKLRHYKPLKRCKFPTYVKAGMCDCCPYCMCCHKPRRSK